MGGLCPRVLCVCISEGVKTFFSFGPSLLSLVSIVSVFSISGTARFSFVRSFVRSYVGTWSEYKYILNGMGWTKKGRGDYVWAPRDRCWTALACYSDLQLVN